MNDNENFLEKIDKLTKEPNKQANKQAIKHVDGPFTVDKFIDSFNCGAKLIDFYVKDLLERGLPMEDVTVEIKYNGETLSMRECCDLMNDYVAKNKELEKKVESLLHSNDALIDNLQAILYTHNQLRKQVSDVFEEIYGLMDFQLIDARMMRRYARKCGVDLNEK